MVQFSYALVVSTCFNLPLGPQTAGVINELKKMEARLGSAETDLGLLSDDDLEASLKDAIQQQAEALRSEFPKYLAPYFDTWLRRHDPNKHAKQNGIKWYK